MLANCNGRSPQQYDEAGIENPIAFISRKLLSNETKWDIWEIELAAVVWATAAFRHYLAAVTFELVTDSKVVSALLKKEIPSRRANWVIRLSEFHFTITHRKGELNRNADFFSRCVFDHVDTYQNWCEAQILKKGLPPIVSKGSSMNALEAKESKDDPQVFEDEDIKSLDMNVMLRHIAKRFKLSRCTC